MHALTDIAQKVCKKKTKQGQPPTQTNKRRVLVETDNNSVVWAYLAMYGGKSSPEGHEPAGQKSKSVQKPTYCWVFLCFFPLKVAIPAYYTWIPLSLSIHVLPSEFASRSYSTPHKTAVIASLCHIQHHTRWQSLSLCINLTFT